MASLQLVNIHGEWPVTVLTLPDNGTWFRAKDLIGTGYIVRVNANNVLYYNLPASAPFKEHLGALLKRAGTKSVAALPKPEGCPSLLPSDVMLNAFGVLYLTTKLGNRGSEGLSGVQVSIYQYIMPLLQSQPRHCVIPSAPAPQKLDMAALELDPNTLWFNIETFAYQALEAPMPRRVLETMIQQHMPPEGKACIRYDLRMPVLAAPFAVQCIAAGLRENCREAAESKTLSSRDRTAREMKVLKMLRADAVKLASDIASHWH